MRNSSAQSLLLVVFIISTFAATTMTLTALTTRELEIREIEESSIKTRYTSEAGYERALHYLKTIKRDWPTYPYRQKIILRNKNTETLESFPVPVEINTLALISQVPSKMEIDCSNVRFTESNGISLLRYYLEPGTCNTTNTTFWVEVSGIAGFDRETEIYFYYGAVGVDPGHDETVCPAGIQTDPITTSDFCTEFYDDFLVLDQNVWSVVGETNDWCTTYYDITVDPGDPGDNELHIYSESDDPLWMGPPMCGFWFTNLRPFELETFQVIVEGRADIHDDYRGGGTVLEARIKDQLGDWFGYGHRLTGDWCLHLYRWLNYNPDTGTGTYDIPVQGWNCGQNPTFSSEFIYTKYGNNVDLDLTGFRAQNYTYSPATDLDSPFKIELWSNARAIRWGGIPYIFYESFWDSVLVQKYAPNRLDNQPPDIDEIELDPVEEDVPEGMLTGQVSIDRDDCDDALRCAADCSCAQVGTLATGATFQYEYSVVISPWQTLRYKVEDSECLAAGFALEDCESGDYCGCPSVFSQCCCSPGKGNFCIDSQGERWAP